MYTKILFCALSCIMLVSSCKSKTEEGASLTTNSFRVVRPVILDTTYNVDYISDIHSHRNVEIRARVKGYLEQIFVDEGNFVKKGQILFRTSSHEFKVELLKAKAKLKNAVAEAKAADLQLQNAKMLFEKNVVSRTELELAESKLAAFNAMIEEAQSEQESALIKLSFTEIRAPFDGIIDRIPNKVGSLIDEGMLLTTLSDNSSIYAYFNVSEKEYLDFSTKITSNANSKEVFLILANGVKYPFSGFVETIDGEFNKTTGSIAFRAKFPNPDRLLKHGASGKIRTVQEVKNAMVIPQKSTFEIQDRNYVYVVNSENKIQTKSFVPKIRIPHLYIIESGLSTNDFILYEGIQDVKEGMKVQSHEVDFKTILNELVN